MKNPWGVSFSGGSPFWVSNQASSDSTLYNTAFMSQALVVAVTNPTGQVFSNIAGNFLVGTTGPSTFIFASLNGTIAGWNSASNTGNPPGMNVSTTEFTATDGAVFTGLANGASGGNNLLYAADVKNGRIDTISSTWALTTVPGGFTDPGLPANYTPYNVQNVNGKLYVEYEKLDPTTHAPIAGGIVDAFDTSGNFLQRLATDAHLNQPWGVALSPAGFGDFGNDILIGNFGDGTISVFDQSGNFLGTLANASGPLVNSGLWVLNFRASGSGFDPNTLFITAGINGQKDGLFAAIQAAPEPSTWVMLALGLGAVIAAQRRLATH